MTVEISKKIREALKAAGYGKADVSVYNKGYSMGSTVYVTIKRAEVPLTQIEELANQHERVDRDESGEILGGGNCFVDVRYEHELLDPHEARINDQYQRGRRQFGPFRLEQGRDRFTLVIWRDDGESGTPGLNVDADNPGGGLARTIAAAGLLEVLDEIDFTVEPGSDAPANDAAEPADPALTRDEIDAAERAEAVNVTLAALARSQRESAPLLDPLPRLPGEREDDYSERLVRRIVRAAERWKAAYPCPLRAVEPRLHALWCAVERLVAHDEGRDPFIDGDQG